MSVEGQTSRPPSKKALALITAGALALAGVLLVAVVLPAEFQLDPTGFGKATGLYKLGTPQPEATTVAAGTTSTTRYYPAAYRSDWVEIPLAAKGDPHRGDELEYKVAMKVGDSLVYSWSIDGAPKPEEFYFDFHAETPAVGDKKAVVAEYKQSTGTSSNGVLVAPIPGVHGWYLQNRSAKPVLVKLKLAGFYELVPPGDYGNDAGIEANKPRAGWGPVE